MGIATKYTILTLNNIRSYQETVSVVQRRRVTGSNSKMFYELLSPLHIQLSNKQNIIIPTGFRWDLSSVPRLLWGILPPDGDFELAGLIHDYLYINKISSRKFADKEMLLWSKTVSGTKNKISIRNLDNQLRYLAVRVFGNIVWKRGLKKLKQ